MQLVYKPGEEQTLNAMVQYLLTSLDALVAEEVQEQARLREERKHTLRARCKEEFERQEKEKRLKTFALLNEEFPHDPQLRGELGGILIGAGLYDETVDYLKDALETDPGLLPLYNLIAIALRKLERFEQAEQYYLRTKGDTSLRHSLSLFLGSSMAGGSCVNGHHLVGVVLAGGLSSRMGRDKLQIKFLESDGPDLLDKTAELLARHCGRVVVASGVRQDIAGYECIQDFVGGTGPIAGIQAVLSVTGKAVLVLACDLPFMDDATVQTLVHEHARRPDTAIMTAFRQAETGFIEALAAVYEPACLSFFDDAVAAGERRVNSVVPPALRHDILYACTEALPFFNINYPADLAVARRVAADVYGVPAGGYAVKSA